MSAAPTAINPTTDELVALSTVAFERLDASAVFSAATAAVPRIAPCRAEATYRLIGDTWERFPQTQQEQPDIDRLVAASSGSGALAVPGRAWGWALLLKNQNNVEGTLIVSAAQQPSNGHLQLLMVLAKQTGAALASIGLQRHDERCAQELAKATTDLAGARQQLRNQTRVHDTIEVALEGGDGVQAVIAALHQLTGLSVALEDPFGNLRCWSGPARPDPYLKPNPGRRERQLATLTDRPTRMKDRVAVPIRPAGEILGVLALVDPDRRMRDDHLFALQFARRLLGYELAHQRRLVEVELGVRRELVDDLIAGTDQDSALARAQALGHDLRRTHYVSVVQGPVGSDSVVAAAGRAAAVLHLSRLQGRRGRLVVLVTEGRPDPQALHRALSQSIDPGTCAIGIGSPCEMPSDFPKSFADAQRALNVRLNSATPAGACAYDELGFYRLVDAAHEAGAVEDFIAEWLGVLLEYDTHKKSQLVFTLSEYLENGGNYDDSSSALHIHRSTLRYRLARIGELTGYDLRNVETRFNLQAATRSWRFLNPGGTH